MRHGARAKHWDAVYRDHEVGRLSWYRAHLESSLELIGNARLPPDAAILDVGGGASTLVDDLLDRGYSDVTVLDVSERALDAARSRLGGRADRVRWIVGDVTEVLLAPAAYDLWHDRAALHFFVDDGERAAYASVLRRALRPDGQAILATFALDGPDRCSGLPVYRYGAEGLLALAGTGFRLAETRQEAHMTPGGVEHKFTWVRLVAGPPPPPARQSGPPPHPRAAGGRRASVR